ncbi:GNAT family N-acetyltransferase [Sporosarcina sp. Te-1]|uniref:GNAT family N-acetyltransferase n=1 Tax=Sporosarcina sp. Te-1 TaxID=2818390 RepID=UPI001A9E7472|nr:GNAT family N-acetyltransferase [Sporosarcina sp. Te-1]QTD39604.1 GNAT family N-acetyltransferase [Sporosarcina sp. Te-1]
MEWNCQMLSRMDGNEVYDMLRLRVDVFVVEQSCAYPELDGLDGEAIHVIGKDAGGIAAYARLLPPGVKYEDPSIGRVIVREDCRGTGLGHELMEKAMERLVKEWAPERIRLQAQYHLEKFYRGHGFTAIADPYDEDGIPHVDMVWVNNRTS